MTEPLTDDELEDAEAICEAATDGPWEIWTSNSVRRITAKGGRDGGVISAITCRDHVPDLAGERLMHDLRFIAAARTLVPRLIAMVKALQIENAELEEAIGDVIDERDARLTQIDEIADLLGDVGEWSNLHDRGAGAIERARGMANHLEQVTKERDQARAAADDSKAVDTLAYALARASDKVAAKIAAWVDRIRDDVKSAPDHLRIARPEGDGDETLADAIRAGRWRE